MKYDLCALNICTLKIQDIIVICFELFTLVLDWHCHGKEYCPWSKFLSASSPLSHSSFLIVLFRWLFLMLLLHCANVPNQPTGKDDQDACPPCSPFLSPPETFP